tara:strand:+ start:7849 stop:8700 length:852 start_codon:yes stop_codon:yes gene_type:complete
MLTLVMGSKGMLGQALMRAENKNFEIKSCKRSDFDFTNENKLFNFLDTNKPQIVINAAANINLDYCESYPCEAQKINVDFVKNLSRWCSKNDSMLTHISTDHFYDYGADYAHDEDDKVVILNEYARQKYASEKIALQDKNSLVVRTSIIGYKYSKKLTFIEWILSTIKKKKEITGFKDAYTSSIDVDSFVDILLLSLEKEIIGTYNIGSSEVYSKYDLIEKIINTLNLPNIKLEASSVSELETPRASCCGLNVKKIEEVLDIKMPSLTNIIKKLKIEENFNDI